MKKLIVFLLAAVLLALPKMSASAGSLDLSPQGKTVVEYGDWIIKKIDGDTCWELDEYVGAADSLYIPRIIDNKLVVSIGGHCFANNKAIRSVISSSPLRTVDEFAFIDCSALEQFECDNALRSIGTGAFKGTVSLKQINLQKSIVTGISAHSFMQSGLEYVKLPSTCTSLGEYSFAQCAALARIDIPDSVTEIAENAFDGCDNLVICAKGGSYAIEYAIAHGIDYVITDAPVELTYMVGDADGDGAISILDATKIQRLLVSLVTDDDGMIALRGDSNGDGLDILDATHIQRYLAGFTTAESIGELTTITVVNS